MAVAVWGLLLNAIHGPLWIVGVLLGFRADSVFSVSVRVWCPRTGRRRTWVRAGNTQIFRALEWAGPL